mmetsp:Transcript_21342/g.26209  ORF Transcript_21342/g.26209 Transcript_21342/m.26209 type:complete len:585 (+) Transcript_21342:55-1809(+)
MLCSMLQIYSVMCSNLLIAIAFPCRRARHFSSFSTISSSPNNSSSSIFGQRNQELISKNRSRFIHHNVHLYSPSSSSNFANMEFNDEQDDDGNEEEYQQDKPTACTDNNIMDINIGSYLTSIEEELQSLKRKAFKVKIRPQNHRPIIRTLLGIRTKDEFDLLCRNTKFDTEYNKMLNFIHVFKDEVTKCCHDEIIQERIPNFDSILQEIVNINSASSSSSSTVTSSKRGVQCFTRLASGKRYRGRLIHMIEDLTPHLVPDCIEIMTPLNDSELLLEVIDSVSSPLTSTNTDIDDKYLSAARDYVEKFYIHQEDNNDEEIGSSDNSIKNKSGNLPKLNGIECEQACISYLEARDGQAKSLSHSQTFVLQNVLVNDISTQNRSKYHPNGLKNLNGIGDRTTGIIWTNGGGRDGVCSEFDALVLHHSPSSSLIHSTNDDVSHDNEDDNQSYYKLSELWEAKCSISPSSIHDAMTKKIPSARSVIQDEDASISCNGNSFKLQPDTTGTITFGLFGMELLSSTNAVSQLRSTAVSYLLSNDIDAALKAAQTGFVEIDANDLLKDIYKLKEILNANEDFKILVRIMGQGY